MAKITKMISDSLIDNGLAMLKPKEQMRLLLTKFFRLRAVKITLLAIIIVVLLPIIFFYIFRPITQDNITYGVNFSNKYASELGLDWKDAYIKILEDLNAQNIRIGVYWDDVEPTLGEYDYGDIIWQLEEAEKRDVNVILALGRKVPRYPECFEPGWWRNIHEEGTRETYLLDYIKKTISTLSKYDSIKIWQVENEPFFPFGECLPIRKSTLDKEIALVRQMDSRPILIQDSGEGGFWLPSYKIGDLLGISIYRKVWYDFWGGFFRKSAYVQYPISHWAYKIKAVTLGIPTNNIVVTEVQAEPWGPVPNHMLSGSERDKTMSRNDFLSAISYAQKTGFTHYYFWGTEWWLWEKEQNNNPFYWDTAKAVLN